MATVVIRVDITLTSGYTKTTFPAPPGGSGNTTLNSTSSVVDQYAEICRKFWVDQFQAVDPNANADVTVTTQTVT